MRLSGSIHIWQMFDRKRTYGEITLPYAQAAKLTRSTAFSGLTGKGQQREIVPAHLKKIKSAMQQGEYTPAGASVNLTKQHLDSLEVKGDRFSLAVDEGNPLLLTDGGHRMAALAQIVESLEVKLSAAQTDDDKERFGRWLKQARETEVTFTVFLDGDAQRDFVNLQMGRPVDAAHMLSLKVQQRLVDDPAQKQAFDLAKVLHKQEGSPFCGIIRFDSRGVAPLPVSTVCAPRASDLGTSLVGLAKTGAVQGDARGVDWLAKVMCDTFKAIKDFDGEDHDESPIFDTGKVLTPVCNSGKKGSACMLIGVAACLAFRLAKAGRTAANKEDLARVVDNVRAKLNEPVAGNFSGPFKRKLLGGFARAYFADLDLPKHEGVPVSLLEALSASTFGVSPLPKAPKPRKAALPRSQAA